MAEVVLQITRTEVARESDLSGAVKDFAREAWKALSSREILALGIFLALLQVADGVLTGIGVVYFGTSVEGNPLIRVLMESCGPIAALALTKLMAIGIIVMLCSLADRVWWLPSALRGVAGLYLVAAIIPWSYILLTHAL